MTIQGADLREALARGEFVPWFQPVVALRTGELTGYEILARWRHPQRGFISPDEFIPIAEKNNWVGALTGSVLQAALERLVSIPEALTASINISPVQFADLSLVEQIPEIARRTGFPLDRLIVEITESAVTNDLEHASAIAHQLRDMGCRLAMDDFGTGYSSLLHLQSLPFDEIKVDRSFVGSMMQRRESRKIVAAVIGLGQNLGLTTVAEGVEAADQAEVLRWLGCDRAQGFLYGRPTSWEDRPGVDSMHTHWSAGSMPLLATSLEDLSGLPAERLAQLQAVYDGAPVGLAMLNRQLRYVSINQRLADINGIPLKDHLGRTVAEMLPEIFPQFEPYIRRALQGEISTQVEINRRRQGDTSITTSLAAYRPVRDEAGEVIGISVAVVDISERKRMEQALRESEDHYRHMVELNPHVPWIMDADGKNLETSPRWEALTGISAHEARGHGWMEALHPDDRATTMAALSRCLATGEPVDVEYRVRRPEGGWRWMRSRGARRTDESGQAARWYGSVEDIDDRKQMEEALRFNEACLGAVADAVPAGVILVDAPGSGLRRSNAEARRLLGELAPDTGLHAFAAHLARAFHGEKSTCEVIDFVRSDDRTVRIEVSAAPARDAGGSVSGAVLIVREAS